MAKNHNTVAAIDLGSSSVSCVISRITDSREIEVLGIGSSKSEGIRDGVIVNLAALVASIRTTVQQAEESSGEQVHSALVTVPAAQAFSFTSRAFVPVSSADGTVSRKDMQQVIDAVCSVQIPEGQSIVHALPQEYKLDAQDGIQDPAGMTGTRLEASAHIITAPKPTVQHVVSALNEAGIEPASIVYPLLAGAEAVLTPEEREQGVFLIDCGGATTDVALFERDALWFTASVPVAGGLITNDISIGLRTPVPDAEHIKKTYAQAIPLGEMDEDTVIEVPMVGGGRPRLVTTSLLTQVVAPRADEIFRMVHERMQKDGLTNRARGAVLIGGSANLMGMVECAEAHLEMSVRLGVPRGVNGLIEDIRTPGLAAPVGMGLWEIRRERRERQRNNGKKRGNGRFVKTTAAFKDGLRWVAEMF